MGGVHNTIDKFGRRGNGVYETVSKRGPSGVGFKLSKDNQFDIEGKRLKNIGYPKEKKDAVCMMYVDERITISTDDILKKVQSANAQSVNAFIQKMENYVGEQCEIVRNSTNRDVNQLVMDKFLDVDKYVTKHIAEMRGLCNAALNQSNRSLAKIEEIENILSKLNVDDLNRIVKLYE